MVRQHGGEILLGLGFLHRKKIPYGVLTAGNVMMIDGVAKLGSIEDGLCGFDGTRLYLLETLRKAQTLADHDVYCFGRVFHHMVIGREPLTPTIPAVGDGTCGAEVVNATLTDEAVKSLPAVDAILKMEFFGEIGLAAPSGVMKSSARVTEGFSGLAAARLGRVNDAQATLARYRRDLKRTAVGAQ